MNRNMDAQIVIALHVQNACMHACMKVGMHGWVEAWMDVVSMVFVYVSLSLSVCSFPFVCRNISGGSACLYGCVCAFVQSRSIWGEF